MHHGVFSRGPDVSATARARLDLAALDRRRWLKGAAVFTVGFGAAHVAGLFGLGRRREVESRAPESLADPRVEGGAPAWALDLLHADPETLLRSAGELERATMRFRSDQRLVPRCERLLLVALDADDPIADMAGACAVRSLARLGQAELVRHFAPAIGRRGDLEATNAAAKRCLERSGR